MDGYIFNPEPPKAVTDHLSAKGLTPSFSWLDVWAEEHAFAFTVAKATEIDVLTDIFEELQSAITDGKPFEQFKRDLRPRLKARGWWGDADVVDPLTGKTVSARLGSPRRLRTIYQANVRTARAAGQWERIQNTASILPFLSYELGSSEEHRPHHADKEGTILPANDPFWVEWFAPNGWGCKCWHRQIGRVEAERLGVSRSPTIQRVTHRNKRTGEITTAPLGIDPGWNTNPGLVRRKNAQRFLSGALDRAPLEFARIAVTDLMRDSEFRAHVRGERLTFALPIAVLDDTLIERLQAKTRTVMLSRDTASTHNEFTLAPGAYPPAEKWALIQRYLPTAEIYDRGTGSLTFRFATAEGETFQGVIKVTKDGREIFLTTFFPKGSRRIKPIKGERIR